MPLDLFHEQMRHTRECEQGQVDQQGETCGLSNECVNKQPTDRPKDIEKRLENATGPLKCNICTVRREQIQPRQEDSF